MSSHSRPPSRSGIPASGNKTTASATRTNRPPPSRSAAATSASSSSTKHIRTPSSSSSVVAGSAPRKRGVGSSSSGSSPPSSSGDHDERNSCIQVVVRCRGPSKSELAESNELPISVNPTRGNTVTINSPNVNSKENSQSMSLGPLSSTSSTKDANSNDKSYQFDHVYGPEADQGMLYNDVIAPMLDEVLLGYNCTVFAYGQTGTGKTYTMSGDLAPTVGTFSPEAGVIPRTLYRLFHMLEVEHAEFAVRVSFIELYNEELRDLNTPVTPDSNTTISLNNDNAGGGLRIFDEMTPSNGNGSSKGKNVVIQGLEETPVSSAQDGIRVLTLGSQRRQIAATNFNEHSSRSHSIFTITVHIKEQGPKGEDLVKVGKFNLVDLAGSENVGRSGAEKGRAREAGMINQSLLTLGRVINGLVDKNTHVPYRESKLTRLLQDSLGGRTKTCIFATISPAKSNLEETLSTLEYAARAKSIRNRPELNQRMTKSALISQYTQEIDRLKVDLLAAREKNGIYLSPESWEELCNDLQVYKRSLDETKRHAEVCESHLKTTREQFEQNLRLLGIRDLELKSASEETDKLRKQLEVILADRDSLSSQLDEERQQRELVTAQRDEWRDSARQAKEDCDSLRIKIDRKTNIEQNNSSIISKVKNALEDTRVKHTSELDQFTILQTEFSESIRTIVSEFSKKQSTDIDEASGHLKNRILEWSQHESIANEGLQELHDCSNDFFKAIEQVREEMLAISQNRTARFRNDCEQAITTLVSSGESALNKIVSSLSKIPSSMESNHSLVNNKLDKNSSTFAELSKKEDRDLKLENERLTKQNKLLGDMISNQNALMSNSQNQLFTMLSEWFDGMRKKQHDTLERDSDALKKDLKGCYLKRKETCSNRQQSFRELGQESKLIKDILVEEESNVKEITTTAKTNTSKLLKGINQGLESHNEMLFSILDSDNDNLNALIEKFDAKSYEYKEHLEPAVNKTTNGVSDIIKSGSNTNDEQVSKMDNWKQATDKMHDSVETEISDNKQVVETSLGCMKKDFDKATSSSILSLENNMKDDISTGLTPQKRQWTSTEENEQYEEDEHDYEANENDDVATHESKRLASEEPCAKIPRQSSVPEHPTETSHQHSLKISSGSESVAQRDTKRPPVRQYAFSEKRSSSKPHALLEKNVNSPPIESSALVDMPTKEKESEQEKKKEKEKEKGRETMKDKDKDKNKDKRSDRKIVPKPGDLKKRSVTRMRQ